MPEVSHPKRTVSAVLIEFHLQRLEHFFDARDVIAIDMADHYELDLALVESATVKNLLQAWLERIFVNQTRSATAIPSLNKPLVLELARCEYVVARENVIALGNSGTGKTHVCLALGLAACQRGFRSPSSRRPASFIN
jgi:hypothetical protein